MVRNPLIYTESVPLLFYITKVKKARKKTKIMELFALLGSVLSIVMSALTNEMNVGNANQQLQNQQNFSHDEAELANQRALENYWNTQSPEAKVQQYKDAGLSVGLMYGGTGTSGGVNTGAQAQTPGANLPIMQNPMANGLNDFFENLKKMKETENISEDTEKKKQEVENLKNEIELNNATIEKIAKENDLTEVLTANSKLDGTLKEIEIEVQQATKENRIQIVATQLENMRKEGEKLLEEINGLKIDNAYKEQMYNATIKKITAETALLWKQVVKTEAETYLVKAQTNLTNEQTKMTYAERQMVWKQVNNYEQTIAKIDAEIKLMEQQGKLTEQQAKKVKLEKVTEIIGWMEQLGNIQNGMNNRFNNTVRTVNTVIP